MTDRFSHAVRRFLDHEAAGRTERAERALGSAFRSLPAAVPSVALAELVVARLGLVPAAPVSRDVAGLPWRVLVALTGALVAFAVLSLPTFVWLMRLGFAPGRLLEMAIGALVAVIQRIGEGLVVWEVLAGIGRTLAAAAAPTPMATLLAGTLLTVAGALTLRGLVAAERSSPYA